LNVFEPFLYFKSGYIISKSEKNALVVVCPTDTTYAAGLYSIQDNTWNFIDSIDDLDAFPLQFDVIFDDYNFDGQTDIYINVSSSNGMSMSFGHLIIIDPLTKKLELHKEARELADMQPDSQTKTITSKIWDYDLGRTGGWIIFTNKWINGVLTTVSKKKTMNTLE
jgi:hypothetical protein